MWGACPLVMIEWEDSARPSREWNYLSEVSFGSVVRCASVGWLIHDDDDVKALAPNMGDIKTEDVQVSGVIRIPARAVVRMTKISEESTSSCAS